MLSLETRPRIQQRSFSSATFFISSNRPKVKAESLSRWKVKDRSDATRHTQSDPEEIREPYTHTTPQKQGVRLGPLSSPLLFNTKLLLNLRFLEHFLISNERLDLRNMGSRNKKPF